MYRQDTSTLTHSLNLNDPHMQMSYSYELVSFQLDKTGPCSGVSINILLALNNILFLLLHDGVRRPKNAWIIVSP